MFFFQIKVPYTGNNHWRTGYVKFNLNFRYDKPENKLTARFSSPYPNGTEVFSQWFEGNRRFQFASQYHQATKPFPNEARLKEVRAVDANFVKKNS